MIFFPLVLVLNIWSFCLHHIKVEEALGCKVVMVINDETRLYGQKWAEKTIESTT